jgi:hypothetical protein
VELGASINKRVVATQTIRKTGRLPAIYSSSLRETSNRGNSVGVPQELGSQLEDQKVANTSGPVWTMRGPGPSSLWQASGGSRTQANRMLEVDYFGS